MNELLSFTPEELQTLIPQEPAYRAAQVFQWLHKGVTAFDEMTNLPAALRKKLAAVGELTVPEVARRQTARDGTTKLLWKLRDGQCVESVLMCYKHGNSLCLSTQAGCRQGCLFCASAVGGLIRNLTAAEMLAQVIFTARETGQKVTHVVLMGIGEPLDNFDEVVRFLQLLRHPQGLNLSLRHVSLSTCGLVPAIERLAGLNLPVTLSVSLHAPDDETRTKLMPVNRDVGVERLMAVCRSYFKTTGRRVSYEYILLGGINDTPDKAHMLGKMLRGQPAHVNLIAYNPAGRSGLRAGTPDNRRVFQEIVSSYGVSVTLRRSLGQDIDAACGQLRRQSDKSVV